MWLWQTDGTAAGTKQLIQNDFSHTNFVSFAGSLYITAGNGNLWQVNQNGVVQLTTASKIVGVQIGVAGGKLYVSTSEIITDNETIGGLFAITAPLPSSAKLGGEGLLNGIEHSGSHKWNSGPSLFIAGDTLYFAYGNYGTPSDYSYYTTDGSTVTKLGNPTSGPASVATDFPAPTLPSNSITIGTTRYYAFDDGVHGSELWVDYGNGGQLLTDLNPGANASSPDGLSYINGRLIFSATTDDGGRELYAITVNHAATMQQQTPPPANNDPTTPPPQTTPDSPPTTQGSTPDQPVTLRMGELVIAGTDADDQIIVSRSAGDASRIKVTFNNQNFSFALPFVSHIIISGGAGNDLIHFNEKYGAITKVATIDGGIGNDIITSGSGDDRIYGGDGNDWISGGAGNDIIYGEAGNDRLFGGDGNDHIIGGVGTNVIRGEGGVNSILSENVLDDLRGNKGSKIIIDI